MCHNFPHCNPRSGVRGEAGRGRRYLIYSSQFKDSAGLGWAGWAGLLTILESSLVRLGESGPRLNQNLQLIIETCGTAGSRVQPQGGISSFITNNCTWSSGTQDFQWTMTKWFLLSFFLLSFYDHLTVRIFDVLLFAINYWHLPSPDLHRTQERSISGPRLYYGQCSFLWACLSFC